MLQGVTCSRSLATKEGISASQPCRTIEDPTSSPFLSPDRYITSKFQSRRRKSDTKTDKRSSEGMANSSLQKQAVEKACLAFSRLPNGDARFQKCIKETDSIADILKSLDQSRQLYQRRKSTRILQKFHEYTKWLQQISSIIDIAVQTQAGIGCPVWAPIRFILLISNNNSQAAEQIIKLIRIISDNLPRFEIYGELNDPILQTALLNVFADIMDFCVLAFQYFGWSKLTILGKLVIRPLNEEFRDIFDHLESHTKIVDYTGAAAEFLKAAQFRKETLKLRCHGWLKPPNVEQTHQDQVKAKLSGTCNWIEMDPTFVKWNQSSASPSDRLLCIYGIHGCGKSIIASSILERLKSKQLQTLFFSFSGTDCDRQGLDSLARAFLWQLLDGTTDERSLEILNRLMLKGTPATSRLWDAFNEIATLIVGPVYFVIDGIDECADSTEELLNLLLSVLHVHANFRAALLGRPHVLQPHVLQTLIGTTTGTIEINSSANKQDIEAFIVAKIENSLDFETLELRDSICKTLQEKSNGMFLWVKLMIDYLRRSANRAEVKERLRDLPNGLKDAYRLLFLELVERLDKFQLRRARSVLAFTITSCRKLGLDELRYAHALELYADAKNAGSSSMVDDYLLTNPIESILDVCGNFINVKDGFVQLIHFSVKEFLTRPEMEWLSEDQKTMHFRVDLEASHRSLGSICVDYLRMGEYGSPLYDTDGFLRLEAHYPFLKYASRYTISHLSQSGPISSVVLDKLVDFLESEEFGSWIEYLALLILKDGSVSELEDEFDTFRSWLDNGGYERKHFEGRVRMNLESELARRIRTFGEHDLRTEQWQFFLDIASNVSLCADTSSGHEASNSALRITPREEEAFTGLSYVVDTLKSSVELPWHRQVDMILRLHSHLQSVTVLTDHLKMVFNLILQNAPRIPVYALLAIGDFYSRLGKLTDAIEVYRTAFNKVESQEVPLKFAIIRGIGLIHEKLGQYEVALNEYKQALAGQEKTLGKEHRDTLQTVYWIGDTHLRRDQYKLALGYYERALTGQTVVLGNEHYDTLQTMHSIGVAYTEQGQYRLALKYYEQALAGRKRVLRNGHHDTLQTMHEIGVAYTLQDRYNLALKYYEQALAGRKRVLGNEHCSTLQTAHCIGVAYNRQGQYELALKFYNEVLVLREKVLGNEHHDTLQTMHEIGVAYYKQGQDELALKFYEQALAGQEKVNGKEHRDTLQTVNNIGHIYFRWSQYELALKYYKQALAGQERALGNEHRNTLETTNWVGVAYFRQHQYELALRYYEQALVGQRDILGCGHCDTLETMHNMGDTLQTMYSTGLRYSEQSRLGEAKAIHNQTLEVKERVLGKEHEDTLWSAHQLGYVLGEQGKCREAEAIHRQTLEIRERTLGKRHEDTLWSADQLGYVLAEQGKHGEAETIHRHTLVARENVLGKEHEDTLWSAYRLGMVLVDQGKCKEAKAMCGSLLGAIEKVLGKQYADALRSALQWIR